MLIRFYQRLHQHAILNPDQVALHEHEQSLSYSELIAVLDELIEHYKQQPEQRFALEASNSIRWVVHDLALLFAGRVVVPVPPFFTAQQRSDLLRDSGAQVLINETDSIILASDNSPELPNGTVKITYTSGSTGSPKGVCLSADNLLNTVTALADRLSEVAVTRHLTIMPLAVLLENVAGVYLSLWLGHEVQLAANRVLGLSGSSSLDLPVFFQALNTFQPESLILTPGLAAAIVAGSQMGAISANQFKLLAVGGARLPDTLEHAAQLLNLPLVQGYGLSEFGSVVAFNQPKAPVMGTVGQPLSHADVAIRNGEVVVKGNCMLGYLNQPSSWYPQEILTGDFGEIDPVGNLKILGRKKNTIVTSFGRNVDPEWLEGLLMMHPEVLQAAVFGGEERLLTALIVSRKPSATAAERIAEVVAAVNQQLPDYAQLQAWHLIYDEFSLDNEQLTGTGRLRRNTIAQAYQHLLTPINSCV
ncbi:AMP-binding protein [Pseudidiomarina sp.]|uniref:AMP-binding protein n=1 Tax=Pseudidiomarina sp. TaxID=2081707 RepID=UPI003A973989